MVLSNRLTSLGVSPHRKLADFVYQLKLKGVKVISFAAGQPGVPPYEGAVKALAEALEKDPYKVSSYGPSAGLPALREAIAEDIRGAGGPDLTPDDVTVVSGGLDGLQLVLAALTDPGDRVVIPEPAYGMYEYVSKFLGLKVEVCPQPSEKGFQPDAECVAEHLRNGAKAVIIASPDNPTGRVADRDVLKAIAEAAQESGAYVIYDEAYRYIYYEGSHYYLARDYPEVVIGVGSFSKDLAIPGFRLGFVYGPKEVITGVKRLKGILGICASVPAQYAAAAGLRDPGFKDYLRRVLDIYRSRRDTAYNALRKYLPEVGAYLPKAAMYIFADFRPYLEKLGVDDVKFAFDLAEKKHVVMVPGQAFGALGKGFMRVTFVTQDEATIEEGIKQVAEYLREAGAL